MQKFQIKSIDGRIINGVAVSTPNGPMLVNVSHWYWPSGVAAPVPNLTGKTIVFGDDTTAKLTSFKENNGLFFGGLSAAPEGLPLMGDLIGAAVAYHGDNAIPTVLLRNGVYRYDSSHIFSYGMSGSPVIIGEKVVGLLSNPKSLTSFNGIPDLAKFIQTETIVPVGESPITPEMINAMEIRYKGKRVSTGRGYETVLWNDIIELMKNGLS